MQFPKYFTIILEIWGEKAVVYVLFSIINYSWDWSADDITNYRWDRMGWCWRSTSKLKENTLIICTKMSLRICFWVYESQLPLVLPQSAHANPQNYPVHVPFPIYPSTWAVSGPQCACPTRATDRPEAGNRKCQPEAFGGPIDEPTRAGCCG